MPTGHRSGALKQTNKLHKHGKHKSKGQLDLVQRGKVEREGVKSNANRLTESRDDRKNKAKQVRNNKRAAAASSKRMCGGVSGPSQVIALVPLADDVDLKVAKKFLQEAALEGRDDSEVVVDDANKPVATHDGMVTCISTRYKHKYSVVECPRDLFCILEMTKIADLVVFVMSTADVPDEFGEQTLSAIRAFGMPSCIGIVQGLEAVPAKKKNDVKKAYLKYFTTNFNEQDKLFSLESAQDTQMFLRHVANMKRKNLQWREARGYVVADSIEHVPHLNADGEVDTTTGALGTLKVRGYVRGTAMSANQVVHIRNSGEYLIEKICKAKDPYTVSKRRQNNNNNNNDMMTEDEKDILCLPEDELQETLVTERELDELEGEQTYPTEAEKFRTLLQE